MKAFEMKNGTRTEVFHEADLQEDLRGPYAENVKKVLALEVGESVSFPSGVQWKRVADDTAKTFVIACTRGVGQRCKYCGGRSSSLCDYPVTRNGVPGTCDIPMCNRCRVHAGPDIDYCIPHAKLMKKAAACAE